MLIARRTYFEKTLLKVSATIMAAAVAAVVFVSPAHSAQKEKRWKTGRILVQPKAGLSDMALDKILHENNGRALGKIKQLNVHIVEVPAQAEEARARALSRNRHIKFAELDLAVVPSLLPDDPKYSSAWHLPKMQLPGAWSTSLGDGVTVAVLDTGVDGYHMDLERNLVSGWNAVSGNTDTSDIHGHGTQVAGSVAAEGDNALGVASVAWNAKIMPVRITNSSDGYAYWSDIARGLTWAADNGADVANISYDVSNSSAVSSAAQYMRSKGGVVVVAAGNTGGNQGHADNEYMISVSATGSGDSRTSWSSYGSHVDFAAPGSGIWTTSRNNAYSAVSGTSFSSPLTAGVVALVMSANPGLSPGEIEAVLQNSAVDLGAAGWDDYYGFGRIDALTAVEMASSVSASDTEAPSVSISSPSDDEIVAGRVTASVEAADNFGVAKVEFYAGYQLVGTDTTEPFGFSWDTESESDGDYTLTAEAYDLAGNHAVSSAVYVTVENSSQEVDATPPEVSISSPADGSTVSGRVALSASASDDQQITSVNLYVNGKLKCSGAPSVSCTWNTRKATPGSYSVSATARDAAGNTNSASVSVTLGSSSDSTGSTGKGGGKKKR